MLRFSSARGLAPLLVLGAGCTGTFDTTRSAPPRGTIGEELYGVFCDRVSAQALHEDLTGGSWKNVCHKDESGKYADAVDTSVLPPMTDQADKVDGGTASRSEQKGNRDAATKRIGALVRNRAKLIAAFDATFPDVKVPVKDVLNSDPAHTCDAPPSDQATRSLGRELADMLGRLGPLYVDGTMPAGTESLARVLEVLRKSPEALKVLERAAGREGYRPLDISLGQAHAALGYPRLRDMSAEAMRILSPDSKPYDPDAPVDEHGKRIPVPGAGKPALEALLGAAREELRTQKSDPDPGPLKVVHDDTTGRDVLSRPRQDLEFLRSFLLATDDSFGPPSGKKTDGRYVVARDSRGFAALAGPVADPFVDANGDGLPDVDEKGRFVTNGGDAPTPFPVAGVPSSGSRDSFGRAVSSGAPIFKTIDTNRTLLADLTAHTKALVDPDPTHNHETLMNLLGGLTVAAGARGKATRHYPADASASARYELQHPGEKAPAGLDAKEVVLGYAGVDPAKSPLLDLVWGAGQALGDRTMDDTLVVTNKLFTEHTPAIARLVGAALAWKNVADAHPEAKLRHEKSVFWDEMLDVVVKIAKVPGLLEDLMVSLADDRGVSIGKILGNYMKFDDHISYDRSNLNGGPYNLTTKGTDPMKTPVERTKPQTGFARSGFQRFIIATHETRGVAACNKPKAKLHIKGAKAGSATVPPITLPDVNPFANDYQECEVFKIDNLGKFFLDSVIGKAVLYLRPDTLRNGISTPFGKIGLPTVDVMETSAGIRGFWGANDTTDLRPKPQFLNRLVFFDLENDSVTSGPNHLTNVYLRDLQGLHTGSAICPERVIKDPLPKAADANRDGLIHGLRSCQEGDWFDQRNRDATFVLEEFGAIDPSNGSGGRSMGAMAPMIEAFAKHDQEDLFLDLADVLAKHWADDTASKAECSGDPKDKTYCPQDGLVSYESLLSEAFSGDMFQALHDLIPIVKDLRVPDCVATNADGTCKQTKIMSGVEVLAEATRALVDPDRAAGIGLTSRSGRSTGLRNDGTTNPQVTPIYLVAEALGEIDDAFAAWAKDHPSDTGRQAKWRAARSQLVDQFLSVKGSGASSSFANRGFVKTSSLLTDLLRAQLYAQCKETTVPPYKLCTWAKNTMPANVQKVVTGPLFAASLDLMDAMRADDKARKELESFLAYMTDPASEGGDAFAAMVAGGIDAVQTFGNDADILPLFRVFAEAMAPTLKDPDGNVVQAGLVDANVSMLFRIAARAADASGKEICGKEIDPNGVMNVALKNFMSLRTKSDGTTEKAPVDVVIDAVTDINRVAPEQSGRLGTEDYDKVAREVGDFLMNKQSGLEQFYEIVRQGTE